MYTTLVEKGSVDVPQSALSKQYMKNIQTWMAFHMSTSSLVTRRDKCNRIHVCLSYSVAASASSWSTIAVIHDTVEAILLGSQYFSYAHDFFRL
jgi:hypothetical protein